MDDTIYPFSKWVRVTLLEKINGYSTAAVRGKMAAGVWKQGLHWKKAPDGNIMVNPREIDNWIDNDGKAA